MVYRILENLLGKVIDRAAKKMPKCTGCKTAMEPMGQHYLFLIPVFHDGEYTPSPAYYKKNCTPIKDTGEIPTGQRACRFRILYCPNCGERKILTEDFLKVREKEVVEKRELYDPQEINPLEMTHFL